LTGNILAGLATNSPFITVQGRGSGTTATLQLVGNVTNNGTLTLAAGAGEVVKLTGSGKLTNADELNQQAAATGEVRIAVDLDNKHGFVWDGATFFDKLNGLFTNSNQLASFGAAPLVITNGATLHSTSGISLGAVELRGAHGELAGSGNSLKVLQGSTLTVGF